MCYVDPPNMDHQVTSPVGFTRIDPADFCYLLPLQVAALHSVRY